MELKDYLRILRARWIIIVLILAGTLALGYYRTQTAPPGYRQSVDIMLQESPYYYVPEHPLANIYWSKVARAEMIRSPRVLEAAVCELLADRFPNVVLRTALTEEPSPRELPPHQGVRWYKVRGRDPRNVERFEKRWQIVDRTNLNAAITYIRARLSVTSEKETELVRVTYEDDNAEKCELILRSVMEAYQTTARIFQAEGVEKAMELVQATLKERETQLQQKADELARLPILPEKDDSPERDLLRDRIRLLNDRIAETATQIARAEQEIAILEQAITRFNQGDYSLVTARTRDPAIERLEQQVHELESKKLDLLRTLTPEHPEIRALEGRLRQVKDDLVANVSRAAENIQREVKLDAFDRLVEHKRQKNQLESIRKDLEAKLEKAREEFVRLPLSAEEQSRNQTRLRRDELERDIRQIGEEIKNLKDKQTSLEITRNLVESQLVGRIVGFSHVATVSRTQPTGLVLFAVVGLVVGSLFAFFLEYTNTRIRTDSDVKRYINLPLIGDVPRIAQENQRLLLNVSPKSNLAEAFNTMSTILATQARELKAKVLMISSPKAEEGKSTIASNLAISLARLGEKVCLVDCDLRKAVLHRLFNADNTVGISDYLLSRSGAGTPEEMQAVQPGITVEQIKKPTEVENLTLVPAGKHPKNPPALIRSEAFRELIGRLRQEFDFVIIDCPPINIAVDALLLAPIADGMVLLVAANDTSKDEVAFAKRLVEQARGKMIGCILNKVTLQAHGYYYYYYYYYYYDKYRYKYYRES